MLSYFKNYKLNKFLSDCWITTHPDDRISLYLIETGYQKVFNLSTGQGCQNYVKLINDVYSQKDEKIRLKMLMLLHFLLRKQRGYSEMFLKNYRSSFGGNVQNYSNKHSSYIYERQNNTQSRLVAASSVRPVGSLQSIPSIKNIQEQYSDVHNYLYLHIVVPYHSYLIRMASSQQRYHTCISHLQHPTSAYNANQCWKFLNILKSVSILKIPITHIGRYYKQEVKSVVDFIEMISYDLILYKTELEKQLQSAFSSYWELGRSQVESILLQTEENLKENENLFEIFRNRYYYPEPVHQIQPKWFEVAEGGLEIIEQYYTETFSFPEGIGMERESNGKTDRSVTTTSNSIKNQ